MNTDQTTSFASIETLVNLPWYTEGPVCDKDGNIYFTTLKGGVIMKIEPHGKLSNWAKAKCPNGQFILPDGDHLVCDSDNKSVSRYSANGEFKKYDIKDTCDNHPVHTPNDLVADAAGGVYFTDSIRETGSVFYYSPHGDERRVAGGIDFPNGIALSADEKLLLVAESYANRILVFPIQSPGIIEKGKEVFAALPTHPSGELIKNLPDGIRIDEKGNVWVAHYGMQAVQVLSPEGILINTVRTEFPLTSNLCLAGNSLVVTGGYEEPGPGGLSRIKIK